MDDLWGNAWSQPEEDLANKAPSKLKVLDNASWNLPPKSLTHEEADVGLPSWSTGGLNWTESTGQESLWTSEVAVDGVDGNGTGWDAGSGLTFGLKDVRIESQADSAPGSPDERALDIDEMNDVPASEELPTPSTETVGLPAAEIEVVLGDENKLAPSTVTPEPGSPDPFGSFEVGGSALPAPARDSGNDNSWGPSIATFDSVGVEESAWGSAWESSAPSKEDQEDEWEAAREEKLRRDRTVPPELIGSIMERVTQLSAELEPQKQKPDDESKFGNWRNGLHNVEGLEDLIGKILPGVALQPSMAFSKTHTAKAMASSVKLSKNLPIVRLSPMAHLFAAKSSSAWELSVKSRIDLPKDDVPAGWRVEPQVEEVKPSLVEKKSGGLLSFWSKRSSTAPSVQTAPTPVETKRSSQSRERSSSPAPNVASGSGLGSAANATAEVRQSLEKSQTSSSISSLPSATPVLPSSQSLPSLPSASLPPSQHSPSSSISATESQEIVTPVSPPAPSAVSRFLNRFSRTKSDARGSSSSPHNSLALSTDDLEFLSDIVPSHNDDLDEEDQLTALSAMVSSPAIPDKLPPPLAPPPLAPPPRPSSLSRSPTTQPSSRSATPKPLFNDLDDLLTQPFSKPVQNGLIGSGSVHAVPPPLPAPISPTSFASLSKPSTPSPLSAGHSRTSSGSGIAPISPPLGVRSRVSSPPPLAHSPPIGLTSTQPGSPLQLNVIASSPAANTIPLPRALSPPPALKTPPSGIQQTLGASSRSTGLSPSSPLPPPPIEKSPNRVFAQVNAQVLDFDDFAGFASSASMPASLSRSSQGTSVLDFSFEAQSDQSILPDHDSSLDDSFGDFGDFISHEPTSPPRPVTPPLPPKKNVPPNIFTHVRKPSAADHEATAQLVERAAARRGRWPAPPSPIPELLPPPPPPPSGGARNAGLLDVDTNSGLAASPAITLKPISQIIPSSRIASPPASTPPPRAVSPVLRAISPPVSKTAAPVPPLREISPPVLKPVTSIPSLFDFDALAQPTVPSLSPQPLSQPMFSQPIQHVPRPSPATKGGLSAQDLSFFEGL